MDTGGGLSFTVLPGRGMDISRLSYRGVPISYLSKAGVTSPVYYDPRGMQWLRSFFAGMLTTCGMSNAGPPCAEEHPIIGEVPFGLHGEISNTGADNVCATEEWTPSGYEMTVSGRMQEGRLHGEHLQLRRTIRARLGEKRLLLHDVYSNEGNRAEPLMFFYHINLGHPLWDEGAVFEAPSLEVTANTPQAKAGMESHRLGEAPTPDYLEQQFFHTLGADGEGNTLAALLNDRLELGFYLRYNLRQMPYISQWKLCRRSEYVLAFEPGNCYPVGREEQRRAGKLELLEPMGVHEVDMELGIVDGAAELAALRREIEAL